MDMKKAIEFAKRFVPVKENLRDADQMMQKVGDRDGRTIKKKGLTTLSFKLVLYTPAEESIKVQYNFESVPALPGKY